MKRLVFLCLMLMASAVMVFAVTAPYPATGDYGFNGLTCGGPWPSCASTTANANGTPIDGWLDYTGGSYVTGHNAAASLKFATGTVGGRNDSLISPAIDNPDIVKFWLRGNSTGTAGTFKFYARIGTGAYSEIKNCVFGTDIVNNAWTQVTVPLSAPFRGATGVVFKFAYEWKSAGNVGLDDFSVTALAASSEIDARLSAGGTGASATISSLVTTEAAAQTALSFTVQDDGSGAASLNTIINGISVNAGTGNSTNGGYTWTSYLAGAKLTDGVTTWVGTVSGSTITFTGSPMLTLTDGGSAKTLSMKIWLKTTLPYLADNEVLAFKVDPTSFSLASGSASFVAADPAVESGATNNKVSIVGENLAITTQPLSPSCLKNFIVRAGFTDIYGGIDEDYPAETVTISVATGTGALSAVSGLSKLSVNGQASWTDLNYSVAQTGVVLQVVSDNFEIPVLTNAFTTQGCASLEVDAAPLYWDGTTTSSAVPFVVHVTLRDFTAAANRSAYLKLYSGTNNAFHFVGGTWTNNAAWTSKPVINIDANGNWSGWLAVKAGTCGTSLIARVNCVIEGVNNYVTAPAITGTLLNIASGGNGVILENPNNSYAQPGDIVLVRNPSNAIVGMWIAEDNGYTDDQGSTPIVAGGWRMASLVFCGPATFERWVPETWPGNGTPRHTNVVTTFCPTAGGTYGLDITLPVNLLSFGAVAGNNSVTLNWRTASETDNDHFEILRDGAAIKNVRSEGGASGHSYSWLDASALNGTSYTYTLVSVDANGIRNELAKTEATPTANAATITEYALRQNYPNPFNPTTQISFDLVETGFVSLKVYNVMGQAVANLESGTLSSGSHTITFDASSLPSGVYLYRIEANGFAAEKKMLLMK